MNSEVKTVFLDLNDVSNVMDEIPNQEEDIKLKSRFRVSMDDKKLEIQQSNIDSPLYSVKTFEELGLSDSLLKAVYDHKYNRPSHIQEVALPTLIHKPLEHFIGQAQSGTGKTAAFALAMLQSIDQNLNQPQALCLCPTRELARQLSQVITSLAKFTTTKIFVAVPGCQTLNQGVGGGNSNRLIHHLVIGTPGTVWSLIKTRALVTSNIKTFVIDEADKMIDQDDGLWKLTESIRKALPRPCQICLFSATYSSTVREHAEKIVPSQPGRTILTLEPDELSLEKIQEMVIDCKEIQGRYDILAMILPHANVGSTVIFVRTIQTAKQLYSQLVKDEFPVSLIHGGKDMEANQRDKIMDDFRQFRTRILIATDVLSRGIDVSEVTLVINYDLPVDKHGMPDPQTYLHRIGRSGRFGRDGLAINLVYDRKTKAELKAITSYLSGDGNKGDISIKATRKRREIIELVPEKIQDLEKMLEDLE